MRSVVALVGWAARAHQCVAQATKTRAQRRRGQGLPTLQNRLRAHEKVISFRVN